MKGNTHPLIAAYLRDTLPPEQRRAVESWRDASDENRQLFDEFRRIWQLTGRMHVPGNFQTDAEWTKLEAQIANVREAEISRPSRYPAQWLKIAAAVLVLMVSSSLIYLLLFQNDYVEMFSADTIQHYVLPDKSHVWLNRDSRLTYASDFSSQRSLHLEGEAFFDVEHDENAPFIVRAGKVDIEVLGTSFNVRAHSDTPETEVYVIDGRVSMKNVNGGDRVVLTPGLTGTLASLGGEIVVSESDSDNTIAWKNKELIFKRAPMKKVLKDLHEYFGLSFEVKNDKLLRCRVTAIFSNDPPIEQVMEELQVMLDLHLERRQGVYVIDGLGCE